ncbi:MAG: Ig-like domain-containing protein [Tidjanibacter sp.]|nr:Ig-like domain-containing protein [Tidjanibacter sp.]
MKRFLTLAIMALALTTAQASVGINSTNFPDQGFRDAIAWADADGNGVLSDEEIASIEQLQLSSPTSLKGLEYLTNIRQLDVYTDGSDDSPSNAITTFDGSILPHLFYLSFGGMNGLTSIDLSKNTEFEQLNIYQGAKNLATLKLPASVTMIGLTDTPLLTALDVNQYPKLQSFSMTHTGITDLDFSNHPYMSYVGVFGDEEKSDVLNSLNLENCTSLENVDIRFTTIKSLSMKHLPTVRTLMMLNNDITTITIDDCEVFNDITCDQNVLGTLYVKNNPQLHVINCQDNKLQVLIADNNPQLGQVQAFNNKLMWLDLKDVVKGNVDESILKLDNQQPTVQAVKLSPTETGLRVHERLDVSRVLNLRAKGIAQTPKEVFVDGIRYFVFYDNGPDTPNLVGSDCGYEYETKWPYPWVDGNTKDNNLPVTLNVTSWTKHQAFLTLSQNRIEGRYGEPAPAAPTVTRSQDYDGKITFSSSNEKVVKVNAETGELTVVGAGTAIISVSGAETDYRLAPVTKTYTVYIEKATPVIAFPAAEINATYGETVPLNPLTVTWYEGTVTYASVNEEKAIVTADGVVTTLGAGDVTIKGIAPETSNFKRGEVTYMLHIAKASPIFSFEKNGLTVLLGEAVPENKLNVGLYDGEVQYTSSDETVATVNAQGMVTAIAIGEVTITATGAETENCYEAQQAQYQLTISDASGISTITSDAASTGKAYDLNGRKVNLQTAHKGVYIVEGKKVIK